MSLLSYVELCYLLEDGVVIGSSTEAVNGTSIDLRLGHEIMLEQNPDGVKCAVNLLNGETPMRTLITMSEGYSGYYDLKPGEFILATSMESFNLPGYISGEYMQKSSLARSGLEHLAAGWCDPGWHGSTLTLELQNVNRYHTLRLRPGMKIGQMKFFRHHCVPDYANYAKRGQYNGDTGVTDSKGVK